MLGVRTSFLHPRVCQKELGQNGKRDVKKEKNEKEPDNIHADSEFGLGLKQLFKLLQRHIMTGGIMDKETDLNGDKAAK